MDGWLENDMQIIILDKDIDMMVNEYSDEQMMITDDSDEW